MTTTNFNAKHTIGEVNLAAKIAARGSTSQKSVSPRGEGAKALQKDDLTVTGEKTK